MEEKKQKAVKLFLKGQYCKFNFQATSGWCTVTVKVDGASLTETITHNESGVSMSNTWARQ